jgi:DNA-binding NarL/FixJ family response regulator
VSTEIRIAIADDHPVVRQGLKDAVQADHSFKIVAEADNGEALLQQLTQTEPQIAILDIEMPKLDGFGLAKEIQRRRLPIRIIFLTMHNEEDMFHAAMDLGANGYILKESALSEIARALHVVVKGEFYVSSALTAYLIHRRNRTANFVQQIPGIDNLTPTELRVLRLIGEGRSSKEIAGELFINYRTVENYRTSACQKLGLRGHNALLKFAFQHKAELP